MVGEDHVVPTESVVPVVDGEVALEGVAQKRSDLSAAVRAESSEVRSTSSWSTSKEWTRFGDGLYRCESRAQTGGAALARSPALPLHVARSMRTSATCA